MFLHDNGVLSSVGSNVESIMRLKLKTEKDSECAGVCEGDGVRACVRVRDRVKKNVCEKERSRACEHQCVRERECVCVDVKENGCAKPRERDIECRCERVEKRF